MSITENTEQAIVVKLERKRLRDELVRGEDGTDDFFGFQARCIRKFGAPAGVYIRQLTFWDGKGMDPEGWIYKIEEETEKETGLGRRDHRKARKILKGCGVLEEKYQGLPRKLYYRVNLEKLIEILGTPGSTLNQWKRGARKDPETGKFYHPEEFTLNHYYSQDGITDPTSEDGNRDLAGEDGNRDLASEDGNRDLAGEDGIRNLASEDGISVRAITESTSGEYLRGTLGSTSKSSFKESSFQETVGTQNRAAPPKTNTSNRLNEGKDSIPTTSPSRPTVDPKMITEVRQTLENWRHSPVALKHYRTGRASIEDVAECVSQDVIGSLDGAETLLPAVRLILEESEEGVAS